MARRHAPAAARNREALLATISALLPSPATVLEIGSGTGEHAVFLARRMPWLTWQPTDPDEESRASIAAWIAHEGVGNVRPPLHLDLLARGWLAWRFDAVVAVNVLHVAPAGGGEALLSGAAAVLPRRGPLVVAGPFGDAALAELVARAAAHDLAHEATRPLPDGCRAVVLARR